VGVVRLVDGGEPVEKAEPGVTRLGHGANPVGGGDLEPLDDHAVRRSGRLGHGSAPGVVLPTVVPVAGGATRPRVTSAAVAVRCPAYLVRIPLVDKDSREIFSWRRMIPCRSASGRGGQPGT